MSKFIARFNLSCSTAFFILIDILLKLQQQNIDMLSQVRCNSVVMMGFVSTSGVMWFCPLPDD